MGTTPYASIIKPKSKSKIMINFINADGNVRPKDDILKDLLFIAFNAQRIDLAGVLVCKQIIEAAAVFGYWNEAAAMHECLKDCKVYQEMRREAIQENYNQLIADDTNAEDCTTDNNFII